MIKLPAVIVKLSSVMGFVNIVAIDIGDVRPRGANRTSPLFPIVGPAPPPAVNIAPLKRIVPLGTVPNVTFVEKAGLGCKKMVPLLPPVVVPAPPDTVVSVIVIEPNE